MIEHIYKSDAKLPGTSKIYYRLEMTFGTKLGGGGLFTTENLLQLRVPWWHFEISEVYLSEVTALYYSRSKSSLDRPPGLFILTKPDIVIHRLKGSHFKLHLSY